MDHHLNLYFREIVYHKHSAKNCVCGVFSYEALNIEEARLGNLYLVGKISNFPPKKQKNYDFLLNLIASAIKREFYSDIQRNTPEALESALQSANIYLTDFAKKGHEEWIGNFDFTCLAFSKNTIHTGQTGNMLIYLSRGNSTTNIAKKFINKEKPHPIKTFLNIASGNLEEGDKILVSTSDILEINPLSKIKELLAHPSSEQLYNLLKEKLKDKKTKINSLACLMLEAHSKPPIIEKEIVLKKEPEPVSLNLKMILNSKSNKLTNVVKSKISPSFKYYNLAVALFKYHLPKYLIVFFLFLLLILSPYIGQKMVYDSKIDHINILIKRINEIISKSKISLVYQNQFEAQSLLQRAGVLMASANSILAELPKRIAEEPNQTLQLIQGDLNNQENSINNVINIDQPEEIIDLSKNSFTFNPQGILKLEDNLFLYELSSGFLYKINLNNLEDPTLIFLSSKDTFKLGAVRENNIVLLSNPEKIYIYGKNDSYNTYLLKPDLENTLYIKDMTNYNDNLYLLDAERLNILKYEPQANSLNGTNWLSDNFREDLIGAQSITVDGNVYVSKLDGTIIKFVSGKKIQEFKPKTSPELTKGSQIFTKPDMKNLYILDPENKRIISTNKTDDFTIQYISPAFDSLTDFWVTQDETTIYILNGLKIYKINI